MNKSTHALQTERTPETPEETLRLAKLAYTIDEVSKITSIGRTSIYSRLQSGELVARKCGNRTIVVAQDLQDFLDGLTPIHSKSACVKRTGKEG